MCSISLMRPDEFSLQWARSAPAGRRGPHPLSVPLSPSVHLPPPLIPLSSSAPRPPLVAWNPRVLLFRSSSPPGLAQWELTNTNACTRTHVHARTNAPEHTNTHIQGDHAHNSTWTFLMASSHQSAPLSSICTQTIKKQWQQTMATKGT